jgi:hypothetical protein
MYLEAYWMERNVEDLAQIVEYAQLPEPMLEEFSRGVPSS